MKLKFSSSLQLLCVIALQNVLYVITVQRERTGQMAPAACSVQRVTSKYKQTKNRQQERGKCSAIFNRTYNYLKNISRTLMF